MRPEKAALHNLKRAQQQKQKLVTRTLKVAIVIKPDGDWLAVGGNAPESDRMAKALWGTPDGSLPVWAVVQVELPAQVGVPPNTAAGEQVGESGEPATGSESSFEEFLVEPAPSGAFVGPGDALPIIDVN